MIRGVALAGGDMCSICLQQLLPAFLNQVPGVQAFIATGVVLAPNATWCMMGKPNTQKPGTTC
jgi:hypothetical protein